MTIQGDLVCCCKVDHAGVSHIDWHLGYGRCVRGVSISSCRCGVPLKCRVKAVGSSTQGNDSMRRLDCYALCCRPVGDIVDRNCDPLGQQDVKDLNPRGLSSCTTQDLQMTGQAHQRRRRPFRGLCGGINQKVYCWPCRMCILKQLIGPNVQEMFL